MNTFNEHQQRLWKSMIDSIDAYKNNNINFSELVSKLEGAMQVGDFQDQDLVKQWYVLWGILEIRNAVSIDQSKSVIKEEAVGDLEKMYVFLLNQLKNFTK